MLPIGDQKWTGNPIATALAASDVRDAAVELAALGLPVFPCAPGRKSPLTRHGFHDASTSTRRVAQWFARWPGANLAVATGGAGIDVLDIDAHASGNGFDVLERARRAGLTDGWAMIVRTPSGGLHFYYPAAPDRPQRSWSAGRAHIDFRGAGGYALVPPSAIRLRDGSQRSYGVIAIGRDVHAIDADRLKAFLVPPAPVLPRRLGPAQRVDDRGERLAAWMARRPEGTRNASLFWAACRFCEQHVPEAEAHEVLVRSAQEAGLPDSEAAATISSAYRRAARASRSTGRSRDEPSL